MKFHRFRGGGFTVGTRVCAKIIMLQAKIAERILSAVSRNTVVIEAAHRVRYCRRARALIAGILVVHVLRFILGFIPASFQNRLVFRASPPVRGYMMTFAVEISSRASQP